MNCFFFPWQMLCSVSRALGYRSVKTFVTSHLYYLVAEWLAQRQSDDRYTLGSFPYALLDHDAIKDFYRWGNSKNLSDCSGDLLLSYHVQCYTFPQFLKSILSPTLHYIQFMLSRLDNKEIMNYERLVLTPCCLISSCSSTYQVLVPHLVFLDDFEQVRSIGRYLEKDWKELLADCFPKIMVNILPCFSLVGQDSQVAQQRETAHRVYNLLKDDNCLGKQVNTAIKHQLKSTEQVGSDHSCPAAFLIFVKLMWKYSTSTLLAWTIVAQSSVLCPTFSVSCAGPAAHLKLGSDYRSFT